MTPPYIPAHRLPSRRQITASTFLLDWSVDHPEVVCEWLGTSLVFPFLSYSAFLLQLSKPPLRALRRRNCCSSLLQPCKATRRSPMSPSPAPPAASPAPTTNPAPLSSKP